MELTVEEYLTLAYDGLVIDEVEFDCANCGEIITNWDGLVTPCHPDFGFAEGSGHGDRSSLAIFCATETPAEGESAYCGWGGPVNEYEGQLLCCLCHKSPFKEEQDEVSQS